MDVCVKEYSTKKALQPYEIQRSITSGVEGYVAAFAHKLLLSKNVKQKLYTGSKENLIVSISYDLKELHEEIDKSKYILELEEDWDDEGAEGYSEFVWKKAVSFLLKNAENIYKNEKKIIDTPKIFHGPNGSIDIIWQKKDYRLLINIDKEDKLTFYGDYYEDRNRIQGQFMLGNVKTWFLKNFLCQ